MYEVDWVFDGYCDERVFRPRKVAATNRYDIRIIEDVLRDKAAKEANKLYRMARNMRRHGCSEKAVNRCKEEAGALHDGGMGMNLWDILNPFVRWEYAFKC